MKASTTLPILMTILATILPTANSENATVECKATALYKDQAGCVPDRCGSFHVENFLSEEEQKVLKVMAQKTFSLGVQDGAAAIFDPHQCILSHKDQFIDYKRKIANLRERGVGSDRFLTKEELDTYRSVAGRLRRVVAEEFNHPEEELFLASPTFFSRLSDAKPRNEHDEYWHEHIDTQQYGSFAFTTLLYLSSQDEDFTGGSLVINGKPISPTTGAMVGFSSGSENPHHVDKVETGIRFAITTAFTCQPPPVGIPIDTFMQDTPTFNEETDAQPEQNEL
eukprot:TRINITY_DN18382_c0_g1_i1.p1 TRINITY_DN18382_c0_g1~~TRINITY_DN18382_c0_g1_i1.p1  ORF type:complete len:281 (+),score=49.73 TRINITY_DN18382_c0_g1_i1:59-901(+)